MAELWAENLGPVLFHHRCQAAAWHLCLEGFPVLTVKFVCDKLCGYMTRIQVFSGGWLSMRVSVTLACTECKRRNYITNKNKKNDPERIELKKYCSHCKTHTAHKETK